MQNTAMDNDRVSSPAFELQSPTPEMLGGHGALVLRGHPAHAAPEQGRVPIVGPTDDSDNAVVMTARAYQAEMYEESCKRNVIIAVGFVFQLCTGSP